MTAPTRLLDTVVAHPATVVEASAGTGKTYQLEHLVFDLVAEGRALLPEILVVTFTERAASELVARIRATIDAGLRGAGGATDPAVADPAMRARLGAARRSFDLASITTIHAFCQRLLTEEPFLTGRLLEQSQVDGRAAFGEAFRDGLRTVLATDPTHRPYLEAHLGDNQGVDRLEELLYKASTARGRWAFPHSEADLAALAQGLLAGKLSLLELAWKPVLPGQKGTAFRRRLEVLWPALAAALDRGNWLPVLAALDDQADANFYRYLDGIATATSANAALRKLGQDLTRLAQTPTAPEAIVQRLLPVVTAEVERRKVGQGLYDFDDMIGAVARALDDEVGGDGLAEKLRRRYRYVLIDEAQDTERTQWRIFERAFLGPSGRASAPTPVVLIGDPKQAIYAFRGADVHTYVAARAAIRDAGGAALALDRNFRSAPEVVRAVNAILDQTAAPPYFTDPQIAYDHPVTSQRPPMDDAAPERAAGVTLFKLSLPENPPRPLRVVAIKRALRSAITARILRLRQEQPDLRPSSIFVLTRTNAEAREVGAALGEAGIACSYYKQEGLWRLPEAKHVRALLCAIADPADRMARLHAWLTPFFGATLRQLEALGEPPGDHPLVRQLYDWKALADARDYPALWASVFESNGLGARHVLARPSRRRLGLYRQIADELLAEAAARPLSIVELAGAVGRFAAGQFPVARGGGARDLDIQRADLDDGAVQIMTMHRAKGLEATHVFLYGALTTLPIGREVHLFRQGGERVFCAGRPRDPAVVELIKTHRSEDDQRLLYVAMTRARDRLYMPYFPDRDASDDDPFSFTNDKDHGDYVAFQKITGPYRHVNQRLRALAAEPTRFADLFQIEAVPFPAPERAASPELAARLEAWSPPPSGERVRAAPARDEAAAAEAPDAQELARLRIERRGFFITSYSRLKDAEGGYQPPVLDEEEDDGAAASLDELAAPEDGAAAATAAAQDEAGNAGPGPEAARPAASDLPGGAATGLFLHAILEKAALGALPPLAEWERAPEVRRLLEAECRRWDRDPRHLGAAARMAHAALSAPIGLPGARTATTIATASRVRREVDFLFPVAPERVRASEVAGPGSDDGARVVVERGFIRGVLDVLFEHEGRACFADWKSDALPHFSAAAIAAHVAANYDLQIRIYTVAIVRLLGVANEADYERRFGGLAYLFLRALGDDATGADAQDQPAPGVFVGRPSYAEVRSWDHDLTRAPGAPLAAAGAAHLPRPMRTG